MKKSVIACVALVTLVSFSTAFAEKVAPVTVQTSIVLENIKNKGFPIVKHIVLKSDGKFDVHVINAEGGSGAFVFDPKTNAIINAQKNKPGLTAADVAKKVEADGYYNIKEIDTGFSDKYSVKALDKDGNDVKIEVDALSGVIKK